MISEYKLNVYGCGSPIRLPMMQTLANGLNANNFIKKENPQYLDGNSVVWGLIRGAKPIMEITGKHGYDFFQVDNAYFGRNEYFRITKNSLQLIGLPNNVKDNRYINIFKKHNLQYKKWQKKRSDKIIICLSSEYLYSYYSTTLNEWLNNTIKEIRKYTDKEIIVRLKNNNLNSIEKDIENAWCVVTHVSAAALDALRLGVPVVTTGICSATSLSTQISDIDNPLMLEGRDELFSHLAWAQFSIEEMASGLHKILF